MEIEFDSDGAFVSAAERLLGAMDSSMNEAAHAAAFDVANRAKLVHDYTDRTGNLTNSIQPGTVTGSFTAGTLEADITAGGGLVNYAKFIEEGTRYIVPRRFLLGALEHELNTIALRFENALVRAIDSALGGRS